MHYFCPMHLPLHCAVHRTHLSASKVPHAPSSALCTSQMPRPFIKSQAIWLSYSMVGLALIFYAGTGSHILCWDWLSYSMLGLALIFYAGTDSHILCCDTKTCEYSGDMQIFNEWIKYWTNRIELMQFYYIFINYKYVCFSDVNVFNANS